eukprot:m.103761 g.103761  ORF g.103761 m.103761 type:complete len:374 (+) comp13822_c0_seq4:97-1218(+)
MANLESVKSDEERTEPGAWNNLLLVAGHRAAINDGQQAKKNNSNKRKMCENPLPTTSTPDPEIIGEGKSRKFKCRFAGCNRVCGRLPDYRKHYRIHMPFRPFPCRKSANCSKVFKDASTRCKHERTHTVVKLKCPKCDTTFSRRDNLQAHYKNRHEPEKKTAKAPFQPHKHAPYYMVWNPGSSESSMKPSNPPRSVSSSKSTSVHGAPTQYEAIQLQSPLQLPSNVSSLLMHPSKVVPDILSPTLKAPNIFTAGVPPTPDTARDFLLALRNGEFTGSTPIYVGTPAQPFEGSERFADIFSLIPTPTTTVAPAATSAVQNWNEGVSQVNPPVTQSDSDNSKKNASAPSDSFLADVPLHRRRNINKQKNKAKLEK